MIKNFLILNFIGKENQIGLKIKRNFYIHDFWNMSEGLEQRHELQNFVKNTGIIAGLLILSAVHPGKYKLGH